MPHAYSNKDLMRTYQEIALERPHRCSNCGTGQRLSHSHLVPKSRSGALATVKENIVYHCLPSASGAGCHATFESSQVAAMNDFEANFEIIYRLDRKYFWLRLSKLETIWSKKAKNGDTYKRIVALIERMDIAEKTQEKISPKHHLMIPKS